ncbi:unnamed protein product [Parnassius apollo]|uniref:(apollo) hypothetical protein n=1 Tax=Parnassius apollo TaxID=110799 RepID=A0A8S3X991_PARAO|nr:unnamed protein product [Parnassius apollo]
MDLDACVRGVSQELRQYVLEMKSQLQEDIIDLRNQVSKITENSTNTNRNPVDSLITSVQASIEELQRETREL